MKEDSLDFMLLISSLVLSLTGDIDLNQISKLTQQMNIPGGEHLDDDKN